MDPPLRLLFLKGMVDKAKETNGRFGEQCLLDTIEEVVQGIV
jgi:hypothetical protein